MKNLVITSLIVLGLAISASAQTTTSGSNTCPDKTQLSTISGTCSDGTNTTTDPTATQTSMSSLDCQRLTQLCTNSGLTTTDCQKVLLTADKAVAAGTSPREVRRMAKELLEKKVDATSVAVAIEAVAKAVKEGVPQKEARIAVALVAMKCARAGITGAGLVTAVQNAIAERKALRTQTSTSAGAAKTNTTAQEKVKETLKERYGEQVTPGSVGGTDTRDKTLKPRR